MVWVYYEFLICGHVISSNSHEWDVGEKKMNVVCILTTHERSLIQS